MGGEYAGDSPQFKSTAPIEAHFGRTLTANRVQLWKDHLQDRGSDRAAFASIGS
jgi:hypothetical protein